MFIAEPVMGVGGVLVPPDDYFPRIREICDAHDVLFAADEVITGFGRTGKWFALEHWGVAPDMIQFAKAITSGYFPLGGVGVSDDIARVLDEADSAGCTPTPTAPIRSDARSRCGRSSSSRSTISSPRRRGRAPICWRGCAPVWAPIPTSVRSGARGSCARWSLRGTRARGTDFAPEERVGARIHAEAQARGLFSRIRGDVYLLAPPFVTPDAVLDRMADIVADSTRAVLG